MNFFASRHHSYKSCVQCVRKVMTLHRKNVLTWCILMYHVIDLKQTGGFKNVTLKAAKKIVGVAVYWEE